MARSPVPKFGNWDGGESVPYSACFENVGTRVSSRSTERTNTRSSLDNPDLRFKQEAGEVTRAKQGSQDDHQVRKAVGSSTPQRHAGASGEAIASNKATRLTGGAGTKSAGHSPLHPHYQAKKEPPMSSPSWEKKNSYEAATHGLAPSTPGRSRLRSVPRATETPDRGGASVPKFGEWDETDPSSADGFTQIFNLVKEERHGNIENGTSAASDSRRSNGQKRHKSNGSKGCFCFLWSSR